jgi:hypothetical protein
MILVYQFAEVIQLRECYMGRNGREEAAVLIVSWDGHVICMEGPRKTVTSIIGDLSDILTLCIWNPNRSP